jgi:hypothetical protein
MLLERAVGVRVIAAQFGLAASSVQRHETNCLGATLQRSREARDMLNAERLAERMQELDSHVDDVLKRTGRDHRVRMLAVDTGRRNVETLAKLALLHAAQQRIAEQRAVAADSAPVVFDDDPETIRTVLKMLVESGAAMPAHDEDESEPEERARQSNDNDGPAPTAVPV